MGLLRVCVCVCVQTELIYVGLNKEVYVHKMRYS